MDRSTFPTGGQGRCSPTAFRPTCQVHQSIFTPGCCLLPAARVLILAIVFLSCPALARAQTDSIVMQNGDRITGEVKSLVNGVLTVDLDYVDGAISVDWLKVARLESKALFLVQLQDGSVYSANVAIREAPGGTPAKVEIQPTGQKAFVVDRSKVVRIRQTSENLWQRFGGNITLGSTYSKGNSALQYNIAAELDYLRARWGARVNYASDLSSSAGASAATRNQVDVLAYRFLPGKKYLYAGVAGFLQSSVQGIPRETILGVGVGRFLKNTSRVRFLVLGGLAWQRALYVSMAETPQETRLLQNIGAAFVHSNLQVFSFKNTRLNLDARVIPALRPDRGRIFSRIDVSYYVKLFGKIDWNISFYGNRDSQPPAQLPSSDYGSSTGLSWTFGNR